MNPTILLSLLMAFPLPAQAAELPTFSQQIHSLIDANARAQSYSQWAEHDSEMKALFGSLHLQSANEQRKWCAALDQLGSEDLALFEGELERPAINKALPCAPSLQAKLDQHWKSSALTLAMNRLEKSKQQAFLGIRAEGSALPSVEKRIDTSSAPYLVRGDLKPGEIAFTFDDGPHPTRTRQILQILADYGVRATFFAIGSEVQAYPEIARESAVAGHSVASHTWSHPQMTRLSAANAEREFDRAYQAVIDATGIEIPFFRFPYGARNASLMGMLKRKQVASFFWTMDTLDWKIRDPNALYANIIQELDREKGGIVLFHDIHEQTVITLPHFLDELRARNFTTTVFVPH